MAVNKVIYGGNTIIDISDSNVTADKMVSGCKAYGADGEPVEGSIRAWGNEPFDAIYGGTIGDGFAFDVTFGEPTFINEEEMTVSVPKDSFGDATADNVLADKTFTSSEGFNVRGNIPTKTSSDLVANGAKVTVPPGYYASNTEKSVQTTTITTPSILVSELGVITASVLQGTAGYVSRGTSASNTYNLSTQSLKTVTPGTTDKTAVDKGKYTTGVVTVKGDANLISSNIKKGVSIFGVTGSLESGANIGTCDITITLSYNPQNVVVDFETLNSADNCIAPNYQTLEYGKTNRISNVLCGSRIIVSARNSFCIYDWRYTLEHLGNSTVAVLIVPSGSGNYTFDIGELDD